MGREAGAFLKGMGLSDGGGLAVNPGLGLGIVEGSALLKEILGNYAHLHFLNEDGSFNIKKTIVHYTSEVLTKYGLM